MREGLIDDLRRLSVETGSLACLGCGQEHSCGIHGCALIREAVEELGKKEEPRVHAHWIVRQDECGMTTVWCSNCDYPKQEKVDMDGTKYVQRFYMNRTRFCPNCGAIMDQEAERK